MSFPRASSLGILLTCLALGAGPIDAPRNLADWYATKPPDGDQWLLANNDFKRSWTVTLERGVSVVAPESLTKRPSPLPFEVEHAPDDFTFAGDVQGIRVADGWIASFNKGEFGGSIWWFAPDGRQRYQIAAENIEAFVPTTTGLLMLEGVCHGFCDEGSLRRLIQGRDGRWTSELLVDLHDAPYVATVQPDGLLLVVSNRRLSRVSLTTRRVEILVDEAFWHGLYPNSIVLEPTGRVIIGMRHGVAQLDKARPSPRIEWLLPSKAVADEKPTPGLH